MHPDDRCKEVQELLVRNKEHERRLEQLEASDRRHDESIRDLYKAQEATKVYVDQILSRIDGLETKLFTFVTQITSQLTKSRDSESKDWREWGKYLVAATVGAVIIYLLEGGLGR